jgi:hypothetical protein
MICGDRVRTVMVGIGEQSHKGTGQGDENHLILTRV